MDTRTTPTSATTPTPTHGGRFQAGLTAQVLIVLLGIGAMTPLAAADSAPHIPTLPYGPTGSTGPVIDEPARALPETTTVCWDPAAARCWTVGGESDCTAPATPAGRPFRVVIGGPGEPDAERALVECRSPPEK